MSNPDASGAQARARAARILASVLRDRITLQDALVRHSGPDHDTAFVRELAWGSCRHFFALDAAVRQHLRQQPKRRDLDVHALLLIGLYQLQHTNVPAHAALHATVAATELLQKRWARGLVNAVLRKLSGSAAMQADKPSAAAQHNLPAWWLQALQQDWPKHWQDIVAAGNARPPLTLRSTRKPELQRSMLADAGIASHTGTLHPQAIYLESAMDVRALPGFQEGLLSVQDEGAQLAAPLLQADDRQRVLDACAAPGGKTLQLLQMHPQISLVALDLDPRRCQRVEENLQRASLSASVLVGDGRKPEQWWNGQPFDRILLDAPCSATGILRRQPDIRLLREAADLKALRALQSGLLTQLWRLLKPGGKLLYSTCSVMRQENEQIVEAFLQQQADAEAEDLHVEWGIRAGAGRQLLPTAEQHDGFYFARLHKRAH